MNTKECITPGSSDRTMLKGKWTILYTNPKKGRPESLAILTILGWISSIICLMQAISIKEKWSILKKGMYTTQKYGSTGTGILFSVENCLFSAKANPGFPLFPPISRKGL